MNGAGKRTGNGGRRDEKSQLENLGVWRRILSNKSEEEVLVFL